MADRTPEPLARRLPRPRSAAHMASSSGVLAREAEVREGRPSLETTLACIHEGRRIYRGLRALQLANSATVKDVARLLGSATHMTRSRRQHRLAVRAGYPREQHCADSKSRSDHRAAGHGAGGVERAHCGCSSRARRQSQQVRAYVRPSPPSSRSSPTRDRFTSSARGPGGFRLRLQMR